MEIAAVQSAENGHSGLGNGSSGSVPPPSSISPLALNAKTEFHPARKPFNGFINSVSGDLRTQSVNLDLGRKRPPGDLDPSAHPRRKVDVSDFLENGLDSELCFGITSRKIGAGLENLGNTCFLNSVLQCLTYTEPLAAYLQSGKHQNSCEFLLPPLLI
uniref:Uncharacterized protein MANES_06G036300 n=1 Tax=Rhizophora mucronata TaxID=61149 RepID=A0A2P2M9C0_RHIMU